MSFLLDALGKAEKDRLRDEVPELRTPTHRHSSILRTLIIAVILLLVSAALFTAGYISRPYIEKGVFRGNAAITTVSSEAATNANEGGLSQDDLSTSTAVAQARNIEAREQIGERDVPAIDLSIISYSETPATRFAMINGFVMVEGDVLASGERLLLIEAGAVVLEQNGVERRVELPN